MSGEPLIAASNLQRRFGSRTYALVDASLQIHRGESVAITGRSGSGKTTLLSILGLLDTPTSGSMALDGLPTAEMNDRGRTALRRERIGFVFQAFHLIPHLTALENVAHALTVRGINTAAANATARDVLNEVGLSERHDAFPGTLSGGEQQRVAIARAIATQPALVLCDEPTGNLDEANSDRILSLLLDAVTPESAVVIVTHDPTAAAACDRQLAVQDGRLSPS